MSFGQHRFTLEPGKWTKISDAADANVTIDNFGTDAYDFVQIISGPTEPGEDDEITSYRTVRAGGQQDLQNLDEGTVLWARCNARPVVIEVLTG